MNRLAAILTVLVISTAPAMASETGRFILELETGPVWQSSNDVQVPNDDSATRFSLKEHAGAGPWLSGRVYVTWNINRKHGLRLLLAPLSYSETGSFDQPVSFAGASYEPGVPTEGTYRFNSWRLTYRYTFRNSERWQLWVGFTAKIRDAEIELRQGATTSRDDDLGFVPLLNLAADYRISDRWHFIADLDALGGGPGRAIDLALKLGYDINDRWSVTGGYRTLEGGADVDDVYNFAWFNYAVVSAAVRF